VIVPVFIGGEGPYRFLLDTGSSHSVISQTLATTLGASPVAKAPIATSVGSILALVVRLPDVAVGSAHVESLLATSLPPSGAGILEDGISGVIGEDFLSQFDYTLDYRTSRLSWSGQGETEKGVRLALEPSQGRFLVHLPQDQRCRCPVRLVPDSGANGVVLFAGTDSDHLPIDSSGASILVSTLAGAGTARGVTVRALLVGAATLWNLPAARVILPERTTRDGDGLLPLSLFARVSFRHREGYMVVEPR
jgi:predicted aspartyl protease